MPERKTRSSSPPRKGPRAGRKQRARRRRLRRWVFRGLALGLVAALITGGVFYLEVRRAFAHWAPPEPTRIFSDALTLRPGIRFSPDELIEELEERGYRPVSASPERPGEYRRRGDQVDAHLRQPEERPGASRAVRVEFRDRRIRRLISFPDRRRLASVDLEPRVLGAFFGEQRDLRQRVSIEELPPHLVQAVLTVEDRRFAEHPGIDVRGLARAGWHDLRAGAIVQGGSTITQQVLKNVLLGHQRRWSRKLKELAMAPMLETILSKREILEIYLNEIYMGQKGSVSVLGMGEAARFYFGKDVSRLDLSESALLAGIIRSPGRYNPWAHPGAARDRRDSVLDALIESGTVERSVVERARARPLVLRDSTGGDVPQAAYYLDYIRSRLSERFGDDHLRRAGLRVYTTIDTRVQTAAQEALSAGLQRIERQAGIEAGTLQGAVVVMNPETGAVLALVGGREFRSSMFNRALSAKRQVGSLFKPFVYAAAFQAAAEGRAGGLTPASLLMDEPISLKSGSQVWRPSNNDGRFRGEVTLRRALADSINVPAVLAAREVGIERVAEVAEACGFPAGLPRVPALALGSAEATPLQVAVAFGTLAAGGRRPTPQAVRWIEDDVSVLWRPEARSSRVLGAAESYLVVDLMREAVESGTASVIGRADLLGDVAGKTGTSNERRDSWFAGFVPGFLAVVWVGIDDNRPVRLAGIQAAVPIWLDLVQRVGPDRGESFEVPADVTFPWIDPDTGGVATPRCAGAVREVFIRGTEPGPCPVHARRRSLWDRFFTRDDGR